jgi:hypothetical protein
MIAGDDPTLQQSQGGVLFGLSTRALSLSCWPLTVDRRGNLMRGW